MQNKDFSLILMKINSIQISFAVTHAILRLLRLSNLFQELQERVHLVSTLAGFLNASTTPIKYWYSKMSLSTVVRDMMPSPEYSRHPQLEPIHSSFLFIFLRMSVCLLFWCWMGNQLAKPTQAEYKTSILEAIWLSVRYRKETKFGFRPIPQT